MGQARGLSWVVFRTSTHSNKGLDARLFLIHTEIHFQTVVQRVDTRLGQVFVHTFILVLAT